ncbi:DUF1036 domain-containing protein [Maricaulis sp.]|uniref:DUF1036 domain-containing protein n=1 Tax=Maricaulis sp. TaxID=1486257 RepID=UPI003A94991F|tara:strand:- start:1051 stop:2046 length:996 start_codon:yes stop_codon:yes gene_type:complete
MLMRLLILLGLSFCVTAPARAYDICNETSYIVHVATGWPVSGGVAIQGWMRLRPGACEAVASEVELADDQPLYFYAKTSDAYLGGVREWRGNTALCVDEADFEVVANTRCTSLGLASRDFIVREGAARDRTVLVGPDSFGTRAEIAGIQRLLQSAGYPITAVDGYDGRGTDRAITRFMGDAELASRPANTALIDALESRAMTRNAQSGLTVCNQSDGDIAAAIGYRTGEIWQSRGWWRLHAGECARLLAARLETVNNFFYAERLTPTARRPINGGQDAFCIAPARFLAEERTSCAERGYATANFRRIPEPVDGGVRVTIEESDFEGPRRDR